MLLAKQASPKRKTQGGTLSCPPLQSTAPPAVALRGQMPKPENKEPKEQAASESCSQAVKYTASAYSRTLPLLSEEGEASTVIGTNALKWRRRTPHWKNLSWYPELIFLCDLHCLFQFFSWLASLCFSLSASPSCCGSLLFIIFDCISCLNLANKLPVTTLIPTPASEGLSCASDSFRLVHLCAGAFLESLFRGFPVKAPTKPKFLNSQSSTIWLDTAISWQALNSVPLRLLVPFVLDLNYVFPPPLPPASAGEMLVASFILQGTELRELADSIILQMNLKSTLPQSPTDHPCRDTLTLNSLIVPFCL